MEKKLQKLPTGVQTFEIIRTEDYIYVDKTKYIIDLINNGRVYFLSRPRRFGKSLTLSTLNALFSGKKELFKGLYAEKFLNSPDFKSHPVIHLDMSKITTNRGVEILEESINQNILNIAKELDIEIINDISPYDNFNQLIYNTVKKYNQRVVILLDEYDKPYIDFINDKEKAEEIRNVLKHFYITLKNNDAYIKFVFITGISKFAKMGVFSNLNSLTDISMRDEYAEMCGYTEAEILHYFDDYLEITKEKWGISKEELIIKMRKYYDGFSFNGKLHVFNPFSVLLFFGDKEFYNYWIDGGTSEMIAQYLKDKNLTIEQFKNIPITKDFAKNPGDMDTTYPEGYLLQGGFLTLYQDEYGEFSLDYPNIEVLNAMSALVTKNLFPNNFNNIQYSAISSLFSGQVENFVEVINTLLASIPYDDYTNAAKQNIMLNSYKFPVQEWLYRSSIFAFLRGCGVVVVAEMHTNLGRADLVVSCKEKIWVIEIKVAYKGEDVKKKADEALKQIIDNNYAKPYPNAISIGLAIDNSVRQITEIRKK